MEMRISPWPPAMSTSTLMPLKSYDFNTAGITTALNVVIASLKTDESSGSRAKDAPFGTDGPARLYRMEHLRVDAKVERIRQPQHQIPDAPGRVRSQHIRSHGEGKRPRLLLLEHANAGKRTQDAIQRVLLYAGRPRQVRSGPWSVGELVGDLELHHRLQRARNDVPGGALEDELCGRHFGRHVVNHRYTPARERKTISNAIVSVNP